jgi:hypothetical protein
MHSASDWRDDIRDEMGMFPSAASREVPPTERQSGHTSAARRPTNTASLEADGPSSAGGVLEGRARGGSLAEELSVCWLGMPTSSSAPATSDEPGAARASVVALSA